MPNHPYGDAFCEAVAQYLKANNLSSLGKINRQILSEIAQHFHDHHTQQARLKKKLMSDREWLDSMVGDKIFAGLDVRQQHALAIRYCDRNQRKCTRRFFEDTWMPRALAEAGTRPSAGSAVKAPAPECPGWKVILNHEFPDSKFSAGGVLEASHWSQLPDYVHDLIWKAYKKG